MPKLLIVDDEPNLLYSLKKAFQTDHLEIVTAETAGEGVERVQTEKPDVVILDVRLPDMSGLDAFNLIHKRDSRLPVIMITAFSTTETAIEAMKRGAYEYLLKPVEFEKLREVVYQALEISRMSHVPIMFEEEDERTNADLIVGHSSAMHNIYKGIGRVAPQDVTVLILGESGTGKEMVARAIYHHSRRNDAPSRPSTAPRFPSRFSKANCLGMSAVRSPEPTVSELASLSRWMEALCFSTRSETCLPQLRRRFFGCCKMAALSEWGVTRRCTPTFVSSRPPIATWR